MTSTILPRFKLNNKIAAWRGGQGAHLILIHGVGLNADAWYPMLPELTNMFTVTAIDLPGHGQSPNLQTINGSTLADFTAAIVEALETIEGPAILVGHSFGALLAMEIAIKQPEKVAGAVPLNAIFRRSAIAAFAVRSRAQELIDGKSSDSSSTLERWFGIKPKGQMAVAHDQCAAMLQAVDSEGYAAAYQVFANEDGPLDSALNTCDVPMLFITGSDEPNSTPQMSEALAITASNGQYKIINNARHMMPMTHANIVASLITDFVKEKIS